MFWDKKKEDTNTQCVIEGTVMNDSPYSTLTVNMFARELLKHTYLLSDYDRTCAGMLNRTLAQKYPYFLLRASVNNGYYMLSVQFMSKAFTKNIVICGPHNHYNITVSGMEPNEGFEYMQEELKRYLRDVCDSYTKYKKDNEDEIRKAFEREVASVKEVGNKTGEGTNS